MDARNSFGDQPLHCEVVKHLGGIIGAGAASGGHSDVVKYLLERGAPINVPNNVSSWGLGHRDSAQDGTTPLHFACADGHVTVVQALLQKGADVHAVTKVAG